MGYESLQACVRDLEQSKQLLRISEPVDPHLELAAIQRHVFRNQGPALLFDQVKGTPFPVVCNLFGTMQRARYMFRDAYEHVQKLIGLRANPAQIIKQGLPMVGAGKAALHALPKFVRSGPLLAKQTTISQLPAIVSWPNDGGPFITLPQVYTEHPKHPGWMQSNLGMYRVQLSGNRYQINHEVGMHYQIHRGIGVHHAAALELKQPLRVHVMVGGPPAMSLAAVMPLPEGLPEICFAGALNQRRVRLARQEHRLPLAVDADFCLVGTIDPDHLLPEGPFGDHLGYYSLTHDFPVLKVEHVWHRPGAIWPYTSVGRPPQEDTMFGKLIHELTGPVVPAVLPGVREVHAVDAAGVHPLLLAIGSERYVPYQKRRVPQEILTQASAILGQGQMSLAKYLWISAHEDQPSLQLHDIQSFFVHVLERFDPRCDLHFTTNTTMDTLDYSGTSLNAGSKVVWAAVGEKRRQLPTSLPENLSLPSGWRNPRVCLPGVLAVEAEQPHRPGFVEEITSTLHSKEAINQFPLVVVVDDSEFTARCLDNFLWVTFTKSNPAADIHGVESSFHHKAWGCEGAVVIDALTKAHHAPALIEDPDTLTALNSWRKRGGSLARWLD
jgi:4-hydroxy-3-polyprenylbenzoate decarboxylase